MKPGREIKKYSISALIPKGNCLFFFRCLPLFQILMPIKWNYLLHLTSGNELHVVHFTTHEVLPSSSYLQSRHYLNKCLTLRIRLRRDPKCRDIGSLPWVQIHIWLSLFSTLFSSLYFFLPPGIKKKKNCVSLNSFIKELPWILLGIRTRVGWGRRAGCGLLSSRLWIMESDQMEYSFGFYNLPAVRVA